MRIVLLGPPGAGKGTQAKLLEKRLQIPHVASGDLLRMAVSNRTALGLEAKRHMDEGALVPDELVLKLIDERLSQPDATDGFVMDGFPRNLRQAAMLANLLKKHGGQRLDRVIVIEVPSDEIKKRISERRGREKRDDDVEDTVLIRLEVYAAATRPLLEYYAKLGLLAQVDGVGSPEQIQARIRSALDVADSAVKA